MRILQVITRLGMGGAERVAASLSVALVARGHDVVLVPVAGVRDRQVAQHMRSELTAGGVDVVQGGSSPNAKVAALEAALRYRRVVDRVRPDIVHVHTEIPEFAWALAGLVSSRARRAPLVRTVHNTLLWGGWTRAGRFAERRLGADHVAAVSEAARTAFVGWLEASGRPPVVPVLIYNGIDMATLANGPRAPNVPARLGFAARFEPQKGLDVLLAALPELMADGANFKVDFLGDGSLAADVRSAAARWPDRVTVGLPTGDLRSHLDDYDAILMPSRYEGLPLLAVETLGTGVPLLATDAPGLAEVIPASYPGRCRPGDPAAYAEVVHAFLADRSPWQAAGEPARLEIREKFALEAMVRGYEELYASVIS